MTSRGIRAIFACLAILLVVAIYAGSLDGPFVFDDQQNILDNPHVRMVDLSLEGLVRAARESPIANRLVANASFALNYYFGRYDTLGYRLVNLLVHLATGYFFYRLVFVTLGLPALRVGYPRRREIAGFCALIWLVHPMATQSVAYIVQRMNGLSAMFYVLALLLYVEGRLATSHRACLPRLIGSAVAAVLALGSKEIAATLPVFVLLYEWYFIQDLEANWIKSRGKFIAGAAVTLLLVALLFLGTRPLTRIVAGYATRDFSMTERLMTEPRVVVTYLSLLALPLPSRLCLEHDFTLSRSLGDPLTTVPSMLAVAALLGLVAVCARRQRLLSFGILWFLGNLAIESSFIGLEIIFEHRTYLPSMGLVVPLVAWVYRRSPRRWLGVGGLCLVVVVLSVWSRERSAVWGDSLALYSDVVEKNPDLARGHGNLGRILAERGRLAEAIEQYHTALGIEPDNVKVHVALANALVDEGRFDEARQSFERALALDPLRANTQYNVGVALARQGRYDEAIEHYRLALQVEPDFAEVHNNLGSALARLGRIDEAIGHFETAIRILPGYAKAYANLGGALFVAGRPAEAWDAIDESRRHGFEPPEELLRALSEE